MIFDKEISRRSFLQFGFEVAALPVLNNPSADFLASTPEQFKFLEDNPAAAQDFKKRLEEWTKAQFLDPSIEIDQMLDPIRDCQSLIPPEKTIFWDVNSLKVCYLVARSLPSVFYSPTRTANGVEHYLQLALVDRAEPATRKAQHKNLGSGRHLILLSKNRLSASLRNIEESKRMVLHELTHFLTTQGLDYYISQICHPLGFFSLADIQTVFAPELKTIVVEDTDSCGNPNGVITEKLKYRNKLGYGATKIGEFFSVAAEYYYQGQTKFLEIYSPYLKEEKAERFYNLVKENLFVGAEYNI